MKKVMLLMVVLGAYSFASGKLTVKRATPILEEAETIGLQMEQIWPRKVNCGIMILDQMLGKLVANQNTVSGEFRAKKDWFRGELASSGGFVKTPFSYGEKTWVVLEWPLSEDDVERRNYIISEYFIFASQSFVSSSSELESIHLDYLKNEKARELLDLEMKALGYASRTTRNLQKSHMKSAFLFRSLRYKLFPEAMKSEGLLELGYGLEFYNSIAMEHDVLQSRFSFLEKELAKPENTSESRFFLYSAAMYATVMDRSGPLWKKFLDRESNLGLYWGKLNFIKTDDYLAYKVDKLKPVYLGGNKN